MKTPDPKPLTLPTEPSKRKEKPGKVCTRGSGVRTIIASDRIKDSL